MEHSDLQKEDKQPPERLFGTTLLLPQNKQNSTAPIQNSAPTSPMEARPLAKLHKKAAKYKNHRQLERARSDNPLAEKVKQNDEILEMLSNLSLNQHRQSTISLLDPSLYHSTQYLVFPLLKNVSTSTKDAVKPQLVQFPSDMLAYESTEIQNELDDETNFRSHHRPSFIEHKDIWASDTSLEEDTKLADDVISVEKKYELYFSVASPTDSRSLADYINPL
jgi:hypothetical protein